MGFSGVTDSFATPEMPERFKLIVAISNCGTGGAKMVVGDLENPTYKD
jgi:hypothetical protein